MKSKAIFGLLVLSVFSIGFAAVTAQSVQAKKDEVTLCHATSSRTNPYGPKAITVDADSVIKQGHGGHTGNIFDPSDATQENWGDIIPAFDYIDKDGKTQSYPGMNLPAGQAWLDNNCQKPGTPAINYCDTTLVEGSVANWLQKNGINGADCFDSAVDQACGYLNVTITAQPEPGYASRFRAVYTTNGPVASPYENFPATFAEDFNGGSVDVTWFTVGPEKDWLIGTAFPNFWSNVGETIKVNTNCEKESTPAVIKAAVKCVTYQHQAKIELTLTNSGETDGEVSVNGEIVNVPAESSVVSYFDSKTNVKVVDGEEVILEQTLDCTPGQGGGVITPETPKAPEAPETPKTPEAPETPKTPEAPESQKSPESPIVLPNTFGASTPLVSAGALSFASLILVAGTAIKSRLLA